MVSYISDLILVCVCLKDTGITRDAVQVLFLDVIPLPNGQSDNQTSLVYYESSFSDCSC